MARELATPFQDRFLGYPLLLHSELDPAECERRLHATFVDARSRRQGAASDSQCGDQSRQDAFVIRTTYRRLDPRDSRLFLAVRLVPDGGGTKLVCRHTAFLRRWARNATIGILIVGFVLLSTIIVRAIVDLRFLDWMLFGLPLVVFALAQLNAPFTARARQERESVARYLAWLLA